MEYMCTRFCVDSSSYFSLERGHTDTVTDATIIIIIIKFFNKKLSNATSHNGEDNGVQIIVNNNVYTKLLSRNIVYSDR